MNKAFSSATLEASSERYSTHKVLNQAKPASGFNAFTGDAVLRAAIEREAPWAADRCEALGAIAGDEKVQELARLANRHLPELMRKQAGEPAVERSDGGAGGAGDDDVGHERISSRNFSIFLRSSLSSWLFLPRRLLSFFSSFPLRS